MEPRLSVIIPTFNNLEVLRRCLDSWERFASGQPVELLVIEDGCKDATPAFLEERSKTEWGRRFLRWFHEQDVHQLKCNNRGFREARAPLSLPQYVMPRPCGSPRLSASRYENHPPSSALRHDRPPASPDSILSPARSCARSDAGSPGRT